MTTLAPVREPVSLDIVAYNAIKEAILTIQLLPGQTLIESDLAEQLNISKTPVRSALLRLEREGLVVKSHYKGAVVSELTTQRMVEFFQVRAALEGLATRLAVEKASEEEVQNLADILQTEKDALRERRIDDASEMNVRFHKMLIESSQNEWLRNTLANLDDHLRRYRVLSNYQKGRLDKSVLEHEKILEAIYSHDVDAAEAAMKNHLNSVVEDLDHESLEALITNIQQKE